MSTVTFDTLKFVETLEKANVPQDQARAIAAAVRDSQNAADVATKGDIALLHKDIDHVRWTIRLVLGGVIALLLKSFF